MLPLAQLLLLLHVAAAGLLATPAAAPPVQQVLARPVERIGTTDAKSSHKLHGRFLHITDFHPDEFYKVHTSTEEGIACHRKSGAAGTYGAETSDCDSPLSLVNSTFDWITENIKDELDFVIWTGDSARHDSDEKVPRTKDQVIGMNKLLARKFADTFVDGMGIPVVPTFGNNDMLPHNILLPGPNKWLDYYTNIWKKFIPEEQRHSFAHGGWFYVEVVPKKLAVFSLNTMYFFDRNAGIDDCIRHSEPGYQQMEWLRIHLDMLRENGMKAILMGHVPPARTDSKKNWDETCWQKYTLWLRQYRDVIAGAVYGHMNIDHFMLQDTRDIDFNKMTVEWAKSNVKAKRNLGTSAQNDNFGIESASDYLHELRTNWAKLSNPATKIAGRPGELDEDAGNDEEQASGGGRKKLKSPKKIGGKWAERYQLSMIGPSIVPNYFPTLRVVEYNITGLESHVTWADALSNPELFSMATNLFNLNYSDGNGEDYVSGANDDEQFETEPKKKKKGDKKKKKLDPNFRIPDPPTKSSPPGPAYSPQPLTFTGYTQYYANLTWLNNDMTEPGEKKVGPERWRDGIHKDKDPRRNKPRPRKFEFEVEYSTFDDKTYKLKDLTVKSMVHLAYRIGKEKGNRGKSQTLDDVVEWLDEVEFNERDDFECEGLDGAKNACDDEEEDEEGDANEEGSHRDDEKAEMEGKKDTKRNKKHTTNKVWMEFLRRAFVSTIPRDKLKKYDVEGGVYVPDDVSAVVEEEFDEL